MIKGRGRPLMVLFLGYELAKESIDDMIGRKSLNDHCEEQWVHLITNSTI